MLSSLRKLFGKGKDEGKGRRRRERAVVTLPFSLEIGDHTFVGETLDLSLNGLLVQVDEGSQGVSEELLGQQGIMRVMLPGGEVRFDMKCVRREWNALGVQFLDADGTEAETKLLDYLETQLGEVW